MKFRNGTNADGPALSELVFKVLAEYGLKGEPGATDACLQDIEGNYPRAGGAFEVVENERGQLVGCCGLWPLEPGVCELRKMYITAEVRGQGLGRQLMDRVLAKARELGFRRMELDTASCLKEAVSLYEKYGFKPIAKAGIPARCDLSMALDL